MRYSLLSNERAKMWVLPLASEKSCSFIVGIRSHVCRSAYNLMVRVVLLKSVSAVRDLGFSISTDLRLDKDDKALVEEAIKNGIPADALESLQNLVTAHCSRMWHNLVEAHQKKGIRLLKSVPTFIHVSCL